MIDGIIANGCSWTFCQNLEDREKNGWPYRLGEMLNVPVKNLAVVGCGNDSIHRRTYEHFYNQTEFKNPLWIIGWSQIWRREGWSNKLKKYMVIAKPNSIAEMDYYQQALMLEWNEEEHIRKNLLYFNSVQNLFKSNKQKYIMISMSRDINLLDEGYVLKKYPEFWEEFKKYHQTVFADAKFLRNNIVEDQGNSYKTLPCGHDDIPFMIDFSNFLMEKIKLLNILNENETLAA